MNSSDAGATGMAHDLALELRNVTKRFGEVVAVDRVSFGVHRGEFFSLLGPSGCGKTTTLRMVAGFEDPTAGSLLLDGVEANNVPAHLRSTNMVFQTYALFPHMSVFDNVAYGPRRSRLARAEVRRRVGEALRTVRMEELADRLPRQLSGGQQQRVGLARALVNKPSVLLLDEPLGSLDLKLRQEMQTELKRIQREVGISFVHVTHDQEESLTMSDRVAIMNEGRIEQVDEPEEIYLRPNSRFVADFIGKANLVDCRVEQASGGAIAVIPGGTGIPLTSLAPSSARISGEGSAGTLVLRPEHLKVNAEPPDAPHVLEAVVTDLTFQGAALRYEMTGPDGSTLTALASTELAHRRARRGQRVWLTWPIDHTHVIVSGGSNPRTSRGRERDLGWRRFGMSLTVRTWDVDTIRPAAATRLGDGVLEIDLGDMEALAEPPIDAIEARLVSPGEAVRITHVLDAVFPSVKAQEPEATFPGILGPVTPVGSGVTNRLAGIAVLSVADFGTLAAAAEVPIEGDSLVDMTGPGAEACPFSAIHNLVLVFRLQPGADPVEVDGAIRSATLTAAKRLAESTLVAGDPDHVDEIALGSRDFELPTIAVILQVASEGPVNDTLLYGQPMVRAPVQAIEPGEILDGAVVSAAYDYAGLRNVTAFYQDNALIRALGAQHGTMLNFSGLILTLGFLNDPDDKRSWAGNAADRAGELGADGVVITSFQSGNSHTDVMLTIQACEKRGIRAVAVMSETDAGLVDMVPTSRCSRVVGQRGPARRGLDPRGADRARYVRGRQAG